MNSVMDISYQIKYSHNDTLNLSPSHSCNIMLTSQETAYCDRYILRLIYITNLYEFQLYSRLSIKTPIIEFCILFPTLYEYIDYEQDPLRGGWDGEC